MTITVTIEELLAFEESVYQHYEKLFLESSPKVEILREPFDHMQKNYNATVHVDRIAFNKAVQANPPPKLIPRI